MTTMCIRVDDVEKKQAAEIAQYYGFDLSSVTRAFWKQMIRENRIPLTLGSYEPAQETFQTSAAPSCQNNLEASFENNFEDSLDCYEPNKESLESIEQAKEIFASGKSRFKNSDEMLASLKA